MNNRDTFYRLQLCNFLPRVDLSSTLSMLNND